jgi:hypothetical protein
VHGHASERLDLIGIGAQEIDPNEQIIGQRTRRCRIEHDPNTCIVREVSGSRYACDRNFELHQQRPTRSNSLGGRLDVLNAQSKVRSKGGKDLFLAAFVHLNQGRTSWQALVDRNVDDMNAFTRKGANVGASAVVIAHTPDDRGTSTESRSGDCRIRAFSTGCFKKDIRVQRHPRTRQLPTSDKVIAVDAADDHHIPVRDGRTNGIVHGTAGSVRRWAASCGAWPVSMSVFIRARSASMLCFGSAPNAAAIP